MSMGSLHVCFADVPQYGARTAPPNSRMQAAASVDSGGCGVDDAIAGPTKERTLSPSGESVSSTPQRYERNMGFFRHLSRRFGLRSQDDLVYCSGGEDDVQSSSTDSSGSVVQASAALRHHRHQCSSNNSNSNDSCSLEEHISCASSSENSSTIDIDEDRQHVHSQAQQHQPGKERTKSSNRASFSRLQRRSTSSLRRAFDKLTLSAAATRSMSCSGSNTNSTTTTTNGTPIKSALKSSSTIELNNKRCTHSSETTTATTTTTTTQTANASSKKAKAPPQRILRQPVSYTYLKGISGLPTQRVPRSSVCCQYARR